MLCSHETDGDRACATKLLWTRVQGGITKALAGTTLAELVEFADQRRAEARPSASHRRLAPPTDDERRRMADLEISNLHVTAEDKEILKGLDLEVVDGARSTR